MSYLNSNTHSKLIDLKIKKSDLLESHIGRIVREVADKVGEMPRMKMSIVSCKEKFTTKGSK